MKPFSPNTIQALAAVVTGGPGNANTSSIGHYRSGPSIERFLEGLDIEFSLNGGSRVPAVTDLFKELNRKDPETLIRVMEAVVDPAEYLDTPEKHSAVVEYLNKRLRLQDVELKSMGKSWKLVQCATGTVAVAKIQMAARALSYDSVEDDMNRALEQADTDPEDAITAACSTVESVCKCIMDDMKHPYPAKQDIRGLVTEVAKLLSLSPTSVNSSDNAAADIRMILSGLSSVTGGIGALRTHSGDAHGKGKNRKRVDGRIARLAIHAASTVSLFFIETWERERAKSGVPAKANC